MKKHTITAKQLNNEVKLMSLVPRENRMVRELKKLKLVLV